MGVKLQLALDFVELEEALDLLEKVHSFADILEVGTPALIRYSQSHGPVRGGAGSPADLRAVGGEVTLAFLRS